MSFEEQARRSVMPPELLDRAWLVGRLDDGCTVRDIADETGTDPRRVQRALRACGLQYVRAPRQLLDTAWLAEQRASRTLGEIAAELGTSVSTVQKYLRRVDPRRF